jgi:hypothetical protein
MKIKKKEVNEEIELVAGDVHPVNIVDFYEEINQLEEQEPKDKRSKEYKAWKDNINEKMKAFNKYNGKIYKYIP